MTRRKTDTRAYDRVADPVLRAEFDRLAAYTRTKNRRTLVIVLLAIIAGAITQTANAGRDSSRDEALKYQACDQRALGAIATNATRDDALELAQGAKRFYLALGVFVAGSEAGTAAQRLEVREAAGALERQSNATIAAPRVPVPDCAATYPEGFEATRDIGAIVRIIPDPVGDDELVGPPPPATTP